MGKAERTWRILRALALEGLGVAACVVLIGVSQAPDSVAYSDSLPTQSEPHAHCSCVESNSDSLASVSKRSTAAILGWLAETIGE